MKKIKYIFLMLFVLLIPNIIAYADMDAPMTTNYQVTVKNPK